MVMQPSQVNGKDLNGLPESLLHIGVAKMQAREHLWLATVVFEMSDEILASDQIVLDANKVHAQNITCVICGMGWKRGREGRICQGTK